MRPKAKFSKVEARRFITQVQYLFTCLPVLAVHEVTGLQGCSWADVCGLLPVVRHVKRDSALYGGNSLFLSKTEKLPDELNRVSWIRLSRNFFIFVVRLQIRDNFFGSGSSSESGLFRYIKEWSSYKWYDSIALYGWSCRMNTYDTYLAHRNSTFGIIIPPSLPFIFPFGYLS